MIKSIIAYSGVCTLTFPEFFKFFWIKNKGDKTVFVSPKKSDIGKHKDDVAELGPGDMVCIENYGDFNLYAKFDGTTELEVHALNVGICPFKVGQKGGDIFTVSAEGNPVKFDGLQSDVPFTEVTLSGKNLYTANLIVGGIDPTNGELLTGVTNCLCTDDFVAVEGDKHYEFYHAEDIEGLHVNGIFLYDADKKYIDCWQGETCYFDTLENCRYIKWQYPVNSPASVDMITDVMLVAGYSDNEYVPPMTGEMTVTVCGKNLLPVMNSRTIGGLTYTSGTDGSVTVTGTQTEANYPTINTNEGILLPKGDYVLSGGTDLLQITAYDIEEDVVIARAKTSPAVFTISKSKYIRIYVYSPTANNGVKIKAVLRPQLEIGSTATAFKAYSGADYTITPDSNPYTVPTEIYQRDGVNTVYVTGEGEPKLSVKGVKENAALKRIWDKFKTLEN